MRRKFYSIILFLVIVTISITPVCVYGETNLLVNGGFENATENIPDNWSLQAYRTTSNGIVTNKTVHSGKYALAIQSKEPNDARMIQTVNVKSETCYRLSGWGKSENVTLDKIGVNLCVVENSFSHSGSFYGTTAEWIPLEFNFRTYKNQSQVVIGARLGMWGNEVSGTAYFDDLNLTELTVPPADYKQLTEPVTSTSNTTSNNNQKGSIGTINFGSFWWLEILLVIIIGGCIYLGVKRRKSEKDQDDQEAQDVQADQDDEDGQGEQDDEDNQNEPEEELSGEKKDDKK